MPHFFLRLIPPRPSFATDMTAEERQVMAAHADYLERLTADAIAFGQLAQAARHRPQKRPPRAGMVQKAGARARPLFEGRKDESGRGGAAPPHRRQVKGPSDASRGEAVLSGR